MKIKIKKYKKFFKDLPEILGKHSFLTFLMFLFIALAFGGFIFYKYSILVEKVETEISEKPIKFEQKIYQEVLNQWRQRKERFERADLKQYLDSFQEIRKEILPPTFPEATSTPEETLPEELAPEEIPVEETISPSKINELLAAANLSEFYKIKKEKLPLVSERAKIWQEKGLGFAEEYHGSVYQNQILLKEFKKELTE